MNEFSPILVPIVAMLIPIVAIIAGAYSQAQKSRLRADQQMALIARGVPLAEVEAFMQRTSPVTADDRPVRDPMRSLGNARRTATVLISLGVGLTIFLLIFGGIMRAHVDQTAGWALMACSAAGLIPLAIGIGFLFDYNMQKREMSRFGLELDAGRP
jgi:hypothetical protein